MHCIHMYNANNNIFKCPCQQLDHANRMVKYSTPMGQLQRKTVSRRCPRNPSETAVVSGTGLHVKRNSSSKNINMSDNE